MIPQVMESPARRRDLKCLCGTNEPKPGWKSESRLTLCGGPYFPVADADADDDAVDDSAEAEEEEELEDVEF
jgi:hypothetical protein